MKIDLVTTYFLSWQKSDKDQALYMYKLSSLLEYPNYTTRLILKEKNENACYHAVVKKDAWEHSVIAKQSEKSHFRAKSISNMKKAVWNYKD